MYGTFIELKERGLNVIDINKISLFSESQYNNENLNLKRVKEDDILLWVKGIDYINEREIYLPAFLVYLLSFNTNNKIYNIPTTTGISSHINFENAFNSAILENIERNAFVDFWYNQRNIEFIKYNKEVILNSFPNDKRIKQLFDNKRVDYVVFDLTKHAVAETMLTIMFFEFKGRYLQVAGCASRLEKREALIKSMLEAYQCVNYAINLFSILKEKFEAIENKWDFNLIDSFDSHFHFYNYFPLLREKSPVIMSALSPNEKIAENLVYDDKKIKNISKEELLIKNISDVFYVDLTTPDVKQLGNIVVKVVTPQLALLTPIHKYAFLGTNNLKNNKNLFTEFPHPFP